MTAYRPRAGRGLVGNSIALLAMTHITSLLGYVFWLVCARGAAASVVGMTSTVIGAMMLIALVAVAGFMPMLTRVLPGASPEERSGLCSTAFVAAIVVPGLAGVVGALLLPDNLKALIGTGWLLALLPAGAVGTALLLVMNSALLGVRRAELSLVGTVVGSVSRLVTVAVFLSMGVVVAGADARAAHMILLVWVASLVLSFGLSVMLLVRATPGFRFHPGWIWFVRLRRLVPWDHIATLATRAPFYLVPIIAAALFPPDKVAYLAMAGMISTAFYAVAAAVSNALLADCGDRPDKLPEQARRALVLIGALLVPPVVIACVLAPNIMGIFGADYARYGSLLVLGLLATFPDALVNVAVAMLRVQRRLRTVTAITMAGATISIGVSWVLMPHLGIMGAGWAALISPTVVATMLTAIVCHRSLTNARAAGGPGRMRAGVTEEPAMEPS
jgi:O-antigen/teichoic acid export membrane protein